ncbi:tetratricopeptide repeat protein [Myxococcus sp. AM009]|uniref:serine/threonine-protein kinase n=1 Tax=Myxococcus sp. AM009 TaxID=2745137 RepID=UPI001595FD64|nr:serine/threonine-protein kinase [Myxococcus sp. AM009]NVJ01065.1 tetratricopeptide repeat protein [Myxococcus sp. AM009]
MASAPPSDGSGPPGSGPDCLDDNTAIEFVEGLCTPPRVAAIERHVDGCVPCRQLLSELARDSGFAAPAGPSSASAGPLASSEERLVESRLERGRPVGRYLLLDRLGVGGMGVVYSAYDPELDRKVALKLLRVGTAHTREGQARLLREAQAMARLQHPHVLAVFDAGTFGDEVFIAMELVEGSTLTQWLRAGRRSWRQVLEMFLGAGRGLAAAHAAGLVHRDFKPDNVLIRGDGRVCVTDFGLARAPGVTELAAQPARGLGVKDGDRLTRTGALLGTPAYMAPEQVLGGAVEPRTDQFSFCVALYEALHGERPFAGETWEALRESLLGHEVRAAPRGVSVPRWLRGVVLRGLSREPGARFPSMEALLAELERGPLAVRRRRVAAAALLLLLGGGAMGYQDLHQRRERCQDAGTRFASIWDAERKRTLSGVFLATKQPYAQDAWAMVERTLDDYTARWSREWTEACEATWVERRQPEEVLRHRSQCLDWRRDKVRALTDLLVQASATEVREAASLMGTLPDLAACTAQGVRAAHALATPTPVASPEKELLRTRLARIEALHAARREREGVEQAREVHARARELGERGLEAEGLFWQGLMHQGLHEDAEAERLLKQAALAAEALGLDELKARAHIELVWVYGVNLHQLEPALEWGQQAQATLERLGGAPNLQYHLHRSLGGALFNHGKYAEATEHFLQARQQASAALGEDHPRMAGMWANSGMGLSTLGRYEEATDAVRHALELGVKWLGPRHPRVAHIQINLVMLLLQRQRPDEALPLALEAVRTYEASGQESPGETRARMFLGHIHLRRKEYAQAREALEHGLAVGERVFGPTAPDLADTLTGLARVLAAQGRNAEALVPIQRALAHQVQGLGPKHFMLGDTLLQQGRAQLALGRTAQALESFERVLRLQGIEQNEPVVAETRLALARVLEARPGQRERARELARQALDFYVRRPWDVAEKTELEALLARLAAPAPK